MLICPSKERILNTIYCQPVRPPVDLWRTPEALGSLRKYTGQEDEFAIYQTLGVDKITWIFTGYAGRYFDPNGSDEETVKLE